MRRYIDEGSTLEFERDPAQLHPHLAVSLPDGRPALLPERPRAVREGQLSVQLNGLLAGLIDDVPELPKEQDGTKQGTAEGGAEGFTLKRGWHALEIASHEEMKAPNHGALILVRAAGRD